MLQKFYILLMLKLFSTARAFAPARYLFHKPQTSSLLFQSTTTSSVDELRGKMLVTVKEALSLHADPAVKFVDGSWFLQTRNGRDEYEAGPRIVGAVYFDIDDIGISTTKTKHMMPSPALFAAAMDAMNISNHHHLIVYGTQDCMCTPRTWYQLRRMGHDAEKVHLMQGSLQDWIDLGGPIDHEPTKAIVAKELDLTKEPSYIATTPQNVVSLEEMKQLVGTDNVVVIDVRSNERFLGKVEEPRPGLRLGHMPGAINLPFTEMLQSDKTYKSVSEMKEIFQQAGIDIDTDKKIITSCGSGVTACVMAGALEACGRESDGTFVYDGSWMEWGSEPDTPIVKEDE